MNSFHHRVLGTEVEAQAVRSCSAQVADEVLESVPMNVARIGHELTELVHDEGDVWTRPASDKICQGDEAGVFGGTGSVLAYSRPLYVCVSVLCLGVCVFHMSVWVCRMGGVGARRVTVELWPLRRKRLREALPLERFPHRRLVKRPFLIHFSFRRASSASHLIPVTYRVSQLLTGYEPNERNGHRHYSSHFATHVRSHHRRGPC
jgi:hypothetical protein